MSDLAAGAGLTPIGMFELSTLGMPTAMVGTVFLYFFASLGSRAQPEAESRQALGVAPWARLDRCAAGPAEAATAARFRAVEW